MSKKANLTKAKSEKNDEFYTQLSDIENEVKHYKDHFKDKIVYLNCDDPSDHPTVKKKIETEGFLREHANIIKTSAFFEYFIKNFMHLGLKKLIATHYNNDKNKSSYTLIVEHDINEDGKIDEDDIIIKSLKGNGDFRNRSSIELLKECDIVVTNPPFSLFREYIAQLMEYDKKFLVVGPLTAPTYKEIFPLIKENRLWLGHKRLGTFGRPDGTTKAAAALWYTNLDYPKRHEDLMLYKKYNIEDFVKYDNYDAIEVSKTKDIPIGYFKDMGVPITFLEKYSPEQFQIVRFRKGTDNKDLKINGKDKFARIIIKRK